MISSDRAEGDLGEGGIAEMMHRTGWWMFPYRHMLMNMKGSRDGRTRLGVGEVLRSFPAAATSMTVQLHGVSAMYMVSQNLDPMAVLSVKRLSMDRVTRSVRRFTTKSAGVRDTRLTALSIPFEASRSR